LLVNLVTPDGKTLRRDDWRIGQVIIGELPREFDVPPIEHPQPAEFGGHARLLGYDLDVEPADCPLRVEGSAVPTTQGAEAPACTIHLTLYWQGIKPTPVSYSVFAHLIDADNRIYAQQDKVPLDGQRPTTSWIEGEVLVDEYAIQVKPDLPAGNYRLEVGLYDPQTFARLPVTDASGQAQGDRVLLDTPLEVVR
jgi:hypothetical protein